MRENISFLPFDLDNGWKNDIVYVVLSGTKNIAPWADNVSRLHLHLLFPTFFNGDAKFVR
jgi:hypothetical protein